MKIDLNKYGIGYKVFELKKDQSLHAPMVEVSMKQPLKQWLTAYAAPIADKEQADQEQANMPEEMRHYHLSKKNKSLAYRPGWHLGDVPYATQFNYRINGQRINALPDKLVFCLCIYPLKEDKHAAAICKQRMQWRKTSKGWSKSTSINYMNGGYNHVPNGYYRFATNRAQNPLEWIITNKYMPLVILTPQQVNQINKEHGLPAMNFEPDSFRQSSKARLLTPAEVNVNIKNKGQLSKTEKEIISKL